MQKVGRFLDKCIGYLANMGAAVGCVAIYITTLMITLNVVMRFIFNKPMMFVEEYSAYLFVALVFLSFAYVTREEAHIVVDVVVRHLRERVRAGLVVATLLLGLVPVSLYFWYGLALCMESERTGIRADTVLETPRWIPQILVWLGMALLLIAIIAQIVKKFRDFQKLGG